MLHCMECIVEGCGAMVKTVVLEGMLWCGVVSDDARWCGIALLRLDIV